MSFNTQIEWTDHTFNPWIGCTKVSPGCAHCYAEGEDKRRGWTSEGWGKGKPRKRTSAANWKQPLKWNREFEYSLGLFQDGSSYRCPQRPRVFCASLADWLDDEVPVEWLADLLALIHATPNLDWQLLTKRPENFAFRLDAALHDALYENPKGLPFAGWLSAWTDGEAPPNVWLGTSVEDQARADERIPQLLQIPAAIHFLSCEPLLGPVNLTRGFYRPAMYAEDPSEPPSLVELHQLHWIIAGGESSPRARPMHPDWARSLRDQCVAADVPFFFKQWGEYLSEHVIKDALEEGIDDGALRLFQHPFVTIGNENFYRVGKKEAGRGLDGQEWSQFPNTSHVTRHTPLSSPSVPSASSV